MIMHAQSLIPGVGPFAGDAHDALSCQDRGARQLFAGFVFFASRHLRRDEPSDDVRHGAILRCRRRFEPGEELPAPDPERMKGKADLLDTLPNLTIIVSRTGCRATQLGVLLGGRKRLLKAMGS